MSRIGHRVIIRSPLGFCIYECIGCWNFHKGRAKNIRLLWGGCVFTMVPWAKILSDLNLALTLHYRHCTLASTASEGRHHGRSSRRCGPCTAVAPASYAAVSAAVHSNVVSAHVNSARHCASADVELLAAAIVESPQVKEVTARLITDFTAPLRARCTLHSDFRRKVLTRRISNLNIAALGQP